MSTSCSQKQFLSYTSGDRTAQLYKRRERQQLYSPPAPASGLRQSKLSTSRAAPQPMGAMSATADGAVVVFSLIMAIAAPLFDSQIVLPRCLYPAPLVDIHRWFIVEFDHYLVADPPPFFIGLVWVDLAFLWPVCVANLYGILTRRRWAATTSLMAGVYMITYLVSIFAFALSSCFKIRRNCYFFPR
uniref:Uncharacterized protein n=1 Tax=Avena sativa TaxID=4498 RepID=A0ACD5U7P4_AVESA